MSIFNSLGSNYDFKFVLKSLFANNNSSHYQKLKEFLENKYEGKAILVYKGREALTLLLNVLNLPKESVVAINGFTCFAVYKAIETAGYEIECLDLEKTNSDLNFTPYELEKKLKENKNIKAVVIQNTLGYPTDIEKILQICKDKNIILIEDLAHCIGTKYKNGKEAGTVGDFVTLSFSQDKVVDAVSGGALVIRNKKYNNLKIQQPASPQGGFKNVNNYQQLKDHLYPLLTYKIRFLYDLRIGKLSHFILRKLNLLSKPMQGNLYEIYSLPNWYCGLVYSAFNVLQKDLNYRRKIAEIYKNNLDKKILFDAITEKVSLSSNLRFPIFIENRKDLIRFLKRKKIYVSDIWYDSVSPDCPNAQMISHQILNLPTHKNISTKQAEFLSNQINKWLKSQ